MEKNNVAISVSNLSKQYRLGEVGTGTISHDLNRWWHRIRGKEDPYLRVGETNARESKGESNYVWSLKDINFDVKEGEVIGIIGRNGAGKSTLLKVLSKITAPTTGLIRANGRIASLLEVGTGFHPEMTGRENIFMNGTIMGMSRYEVSSKLDEIVAFAGVERYLDTPVKRYSSGMKVRLGFAIAAHLEPEILIVDEVLAVGDAEFQNKAIGKMKEVSSSGGRTVLFVSHNMAAVKNLCTSAIVMDQGRVVYSGTVDKGISYYLKSSIQKSNDLLIDRRGMDVSDRFLIKAIELSDGLNEGVSCAQNGSKLVVSVSYFSPKQIDEVYFRLQITSSDGGVLFTLNNLHTDALFQILEGEGLVKCLIPDLPLFAGKYNISVLCAQRFSGVLDEVRDAKELVVIDGNFFGTGKVPSVKQGVLLRHNWYKPEIVTSFGL